MEHITVSPEKVRMGGNIINKKGIDDYESDDADLSVTTEIINLEEEDIFLVSTDMVPDSVVLSSDKSYLSYLMRLDRDERFATLTATVYDVYDNPIKGETVTIYNGETVLGTGVTNEHGQFSYEYVTSHAGDMAITAECGDVSSDIVVLHDYYWADMAEKDLSEYYEPVNLTGYSSPTLTYDSSTNTYVMESIGGFALFTLWDYTMGDVVVEADLNPYGTSVGAVGAGIGRSGFGLGRKVAGTRGLGIGWQYEEGSFTNLYGEDQIISRAEGFLHVEFIIQGRDITTTYTQNGEVIFTKTCRVEEMFDASSGNRYGIMTNQSVTFKNFIVKPYIPEPSPVDNVTLASDKSVLSAFDSESATLTATATNDESAPVEGVLVTFYKGATSLGTATTNSNGVATLTYTATGAGDLTLTAEAEDIISNNLSIEDCIRYDPTTQDKSSSYTPVQIDTGGVVQSFSFDTDHYLLSNSTDIFTGWGLSDNTDNIEISMDFKLAGSTAFYQAIMGYFNGNTSYMIRARGDKKVQEYIFNYDKSASESTFYTHTTAFTDNYYRLKLRRIGTTATVSIHTTDGTQLATHDITITTSNNGKLFFGFLSGTNRDILVKNIKVKQITGV